ncbi:MAG: hypothetical protein J6D38_06300, partial [Solobacterium sp.]|nr:hypothetical protein [Solobacterium sp.]
MKTTGIVKVLMACMLLLSVFSVSQAYAEGTESEVPGDDTAPNMKAGEPKKRFCVVSYDEYIPFSRQLYYILTGLEENGWIKEGSIPFSESDIEHLYIDEMYQKLENTDLGPYIEFAPGACYYLAYEEEEAIAEDIRNRANSGDIDLIITTGTSA